MHVTGSGQDLGLALRGRVALVTGASGALGRVIANRLASMGALVVGADLREPSDSPDGSKIVSIACDIQSESSISQAARVVNDRYGQCDILVNNAGVSGGPTPIESMTTDTWDRTFAVNVRGAWLCAKHFGTGMLIAGSGNIINVASIAARFPSRMGAYSASKAALVALTRQLSVEWGARGVRANSVSPGFVRTPMSEHHYRDADVEALRIAAVASGRIGVPDEIARVVTFLASDDSSYINGQDIVVDGGFSCTSLTRVQATGVTEHE